MLKQKNPALMEKMANVAEREDANVILDTLNETIASKENEAYIKMLGDYVESHIQKFLEKELVISGISVRNEQGGQDLILSKDGHEDYFIEIKSRWGGKESAIMSSTQFKKAVANPERYALISAQMWNFSQDRAAKNDEVSFDEMNPLLKACCRIGNLETDLSKRVDAAFKNEEDEIIAVGSYTVLVPQKVFDLTFDEMVEVIKKKFE